MLVTNFHLKRFLYTLMCGFRQLRDVAEIHPARAMALRALLSHVALDRDIYSSTKTILDLLADRIEPGTVIVFDEYFNLPNWENHEHKAFYEYLAANRLAYEPLAYARQQLAVKIVPASDLGSVP